MCILTGTVFLVLLLEKMTDIIMIELTNKFQKIFFGGHRIVLGLIRIMEERGTGKDCHS